MVEEAVDVSPGPVSDAHKSSSSSNDNRKSILPTSPIVVAILATETAERFAYFGFRAILTLYFQEILEFSEAQAVAGFAWTTCGAYASPIVGAWLADAYWGRALTIFRLGIVYAVGLILLTLSAVGSAVGDDNTDDSKLSLEQRRACALAGLSLICLGTGGIKPCVSAFGADQVLALQQQQQQRNQEEDGIRRNHDIREQRDGLLRTSTTSATTNSSAANNNNNDSSIENNDPVVVRTFFAYFYVSINLGALTSMFLVPLLKLWYGFAVAFGSATVAMLGALILFASQWHRYVPDDDNCKMATESAVDDSTNANANIRNTEKSSSNLGHTFRLCWWLLRRQWYHQAPAWVRRRMPWIHPGPRHVRLATTDDTDDDVMNARDNNRHQDRHHDHASDHGSSNGYCYDEGDENDEQLRDAAQALKVLPILAMFPIFWCLYNQQGSVWTLQAKRMILPSYIQPEQLLVINPIEIMILVPLFDRVIYPRMAARRWDLSPLRRMGWGMILAALSFVLSGLVEIRLQMAPVSVFWQLPQITVLSVAEIFISVTGLEFAYASSPHQLKSFIMALFLLTTAVGDFFAGILYSTIFDRMLPDHRARIMNICAALMMLNYAAFRVVAARSTVSASYSTTKSSSLVRPHNTISSQGENAGCSGSVELSQASWSTNGDGGSVGKGTARPH